MTTIEASAESVHRFERAGLGVAPFRFVDIVEKRGPMGMAVSDGVTMTVGAPGQPCGTCDYCGTAIAECCVIEDRNGKSFVVGNECVRKTGDAGLLKSVDPAIKAKRAAARKAAAAKGIEWAVEQSRRPEVEAQMRSLPSPNLKRWTACGDTAWDWARWMMDHAGQTGATKVVRFMRKAIQ